jgi:hypothetical protein
MMIAKAWGIARGTVIFLSGADFFFDIIDKELFYVYTYMRAHKG